MPIHYKKYLDSVQGYQGGKSIEAVRKLAGDKTIYKLSSNENPLGSSPLAVAALREELDSLEIYPDNSDDRLRSALSEFYHGELSSEQFVTTNSGVANLDLLIRAFMEEDSNCIYCDPAFGPYKEFPLKLGARAINVPLIGRDFHLDVEAVLTAIDEKTRLIFVTSPNNPTGTHIPKPQMDALVRSLPDHVVLVIDEVYFQYADADDYVRALPYVLDGYNVIAVNSFSKAYGLAGMRLGYSYASEEIAGYMRKLRIPFMIPSMGLTAGIAALQDEEHIRRTRQHVLTEKAWLYLELDRLGVHYWKTQANFILVKPPMSPSVFEDLMIREGVMVRTVAGFGAPECVRVTIGTREANQAYIAAWNKVLSGAELVG